SNGVLHGDFATCLGVFEFAPWAAVNRLSAELITGQLVAPIAETAFCKLHDVALMDKRHGRTVVINGVLDSLAHEALRALTRYRLHANTRGFREADLVDAQFILQEIDQLARIAAAGFEFNTCVDVFRVFAEDHHIGLLGLTHRGRHTLEVLDWAQADIQIQLLAQRDVQGTNTAANRGRQRALDRNNVVTHRIERLFRQPDIGAVLFGGLFTSVDFHPVDL